MKNLLALCAVALLGASANAQAWRAYYYPKAAAATAAVGRAAATCPRVDPVHIGGTQGYADGLGSGKCFVSIDPIDTTGLVYRSYAFFDDGLLMVFSSYGEAEGPTMTSAREFYFFPRRAALELTMDRAAGAVSVRMSDGGTVRFNPATGQVASLDRGAVTVSPRVDRAERGGVEIPSYAGLVLDAGFRLGESPSGRPDADSTFRDAQGHLCTVKNRELFTYANGEHALKFTDAELKVWLRTRCPAVTPGF